MAIEAKVKAIDALKPKADRYDEGITGRPGLVMRVWPSGKKVFVHRFKVRNVPFRLTLGEYPSTSLQTFLTNYEAQRAQLARGENPATLAQREGHARAQTPTVRALAERYIAEHAKPSKRSWREDEVILERDVLPRWGKLEARDVTYNDVDALLARIKANKERGITAPRKALAVVRKMFSWAVKKRLLELNPARGVDIGKPPAARTRALTDSELRTLLQTLPACTLSLAMKDALTLQLLTGTRIGEPLGARANEFDIEARTWLIPGSRTKNKLPHIVPLSDGAIRISQRRIDATDDFLFPGASKRIRGSIRADSLAHALTRKLQEFKDADGKAIGAFTSHDVRRTVETGLARLGISREIRDRVLNHKDASVGGVHYNQHDYLHEKRAALEAWARKLEQIASGKESSVTPLRPVEKRNQHM